MPVNRDHLDLRRLQRQLWRRLNHALSSRIVVTPQFRAYERRHSLNDQTVAFPVPTAHIYDCAAEADVVLCADYHTFSPSQTGCMQLLEALLIRRPRVAVALEMAQTSQQAHLDGWLRGELDEPSLVRRLELHRTWPFPWPGYRDLLQFARDHQIPVFGLNGPARTADLDTRDRWMGRRLARLSREHPDTTIVALVGELHLASGHLPAELMGAAAPRAIRTMRLLQNHDDLFWRFEPNEPVPQAVALDRATFCMFNGAPWEKLDSYLAWVDADGDSHYETLDRAETVVEVARLLARYLRIGGGQLDDVEICTGSHHPPRISSGDGSATGIAGCDGLSLRALDLAHVTEAAVELLLQRRISIADRTPEDGPAAFYRRVLRRALCYFCSKLIAPTRLPSEPRSIDAVAVLDDKSVCATQVARMDVANGLAQSRSLGSQLGEQLHAGFLAGTWTRDEVRTLFCSDATGATALALLRTIAAGVVIEPEAACAESSVALELSR